MHSKYHSDEFVLCKSLSLAFLFYKTYKLLSDCYWTRTHNHLVHKRTLNHLAKLANDWAVLWVLICTVHLTVCSYHVTYAFQSESTFYSCLNVKELLARSRREIWSLSDCNWTRTRNHLVHKRTLNHLAKLANDWAVLWVLICTVHLTVCSYHVTYAFQSESTLYSCLNVKDLLALQAFRNCENIWSNRKIEINYSTLFISLKHELLTDNLFSPITL